MPGCGAARTETADHNAVFVDGILALQASSAFKKIHLAGQFVGIQ